MPPATLLEQDQPAPLRVRLWTEEGAVGLRAAIAHNGGNGSPENPHRCRLRLENAAPQAWSGIVEVAVRRPEAAARFFLPGFLYGTNRAGHPPPPSLRKHFPRLRAGPVEPPFAPVWHAHANELTHPVAAVFADKRFTALATAPFAEAGRPGNGFFCSLEEGAAVGFTLGHRPYPGLYRTPLEFEAEPARDTETLRIEPAHTHEITFRLYEFAAASETALGRILADVYASYRERPRAGAAPAQAVEMITRAVVEDAYDAEHRTFALIGLDPIPDDPQAPRQPREFAIDAPEKATYHRHYEGGIAWTNGLAIAFPLLQAAHRLNRPEWKAPAYAVIDDIVGHSLNPRTGLPYSCKIRDRWTNAGWWSQWIASEGLGPAHPAYLVGQAVFYLLKAWSWERQTTGRAPDAWLDFAERVLAATAPTQNAAGAFPRFWDEASGEGHGHEAFAGCWIAAAMAAHAKTTVDDRWHAAAARAERHYFETAVQRMECAQTPLDVADAPDAEGILAYVRLARLLHERHPDAALATRLRAGLDYALSFVFCHNARIKGPPLEGHPWNSSGGAITSVGNAVVHCMTNSLLDELAYAHRLSGDPYLLARLRDIRAFGLQTFSRFENEFSFGKPGWSPEYFCQSARYVLDIRLRGGVRSNLWFAYHPWATAAILEGLCGDLWEEGAVATGGD
ncbi:MAG: hypothetical protein JJU00_07055 [Opitutales bacterium]|nr:hypothetical protein [Opitutales bacterium]